MSKCGLAEYDENEYICALPEIATYEKIIEEMTCDFRFDDRERHLIPELRLHAVMRLSHFFVPLSQHLSLHSSIMLALRQGYIGRAPGTADYDAYRQSTVARDYRGRGAANSPGMSKACSFAFLGCSGAGKSYSVRRILGSIDQTVQHVQPVTVIQVVWLLIECPHKGSLRGLCMRVLSALDKALKTTSYRQRYGNSRSTVEQMLLDIEHLFTIHAVGLLVIDEIQNLREAQQADKSAITKFFVLLVNSVGVPVIPVGTLGAASVFDSVFSDARRASGLGSIIWYPLPRGDDELDEWPDFVRQLWRGQWTAKPTDLTNEILDVLYDETQGVLDLLVILYMLCQMRLIELTAMAKIRDPAAQPDETITVDLIRVVAAEKFQLIHPLIAALRNGNHSAIGDFDGFLEFHESMEVEFTQIMKRVPRRPARLIETADGPTIDRSKACQMLESLGVAPDMSNAIVAQLTGTGELNVAALLLNAGTLLRGGDTVEPTSPRKLARKRRDENELKRVIAEASAASLSPYEGLSRAGYGASLAQDFPW